MFIEREFSILLTSDAHPVCSLLTLLFVQVKGGMGLGTKTTTGALTNFDVEPSPYDPCPAADGNVDAAAGGSAKTVECFRGRVVSFAAAEPAVACKGDAEGGR